MIWLQFISALFAIAAAFHDAPAVDKFEYHGATKKEMSEFHFWGSAQRLAFVVLASLYYVGEERIRAVIISGLWIYLVFDIALNLGRSGKQWHYLGMNDHHGRFWNWGFGIHAGKIKASILICCITLINVLWH